MCCGSRGLSRGVARSKRQDTVLRLQSNLETWGESERSAEKIRRVVVLYVEGDNLCSYCSRMNEEEKSNEIRRCS